jgi:hypothetical protein
MNHTVKRMGRCNTQELRSQRDDPTPEWNPVEAEGMPIETSLSKAGQSATVLRDFCRKFAASGPFIDF